jgi:DNA-binding beta-propeller fold protein YncE
MAFESALAEEGPAPVLNPKTYVSPSGVYSLAVDPTDLYGRGPADYRFTKDGKSVWAGRRPYTLWHASIADSGHVAGYAYTHGWRGFPRRGVNAGPDQFIVALLSADGKALNEEKHARRSSRFLDTPPDPLVRGTVLDASNRRFVVRVRDPDINRGMEQWWVYDLDNGKRMGTLEPGRSMPDGKGNTTLSILGAQAVPGTPLVLTHWWKFASGNCGGVFTLVDLNDAKAKPAWILSLDGDYSVPGNDKVEDSIRETIRRDGAILEVNKAPGFAIQAVKPQQRIAFSVEKTADGTWRVREAARTRAAYPSSTPAPKSPTFPQIKPDEVAVVHLSGTGARKTSPIRDIQGFGFDAEGQICVLSVGGNTDPHLLRISQRGDVLKDLCLAVGRLPKGVDFSNPAHVGGGRFVVTASDGDDEGKARCFVADFDAATVKELPGFDSFAITALAGLPDGRFAAIIYHRMKYTAGQGLSLFDAQGKLLWQKDNSGDASKPEELVSPEDITRYGNHSIAVLDNAARRVQFFDTNGAFLRNIDLHETWKREPNYPTHIVEDSQGGLAVYDFHARNPLVRMNAKGQILSESAPRFPDGRPVNAQGLRRSPDGRIWTTDRHVLLRLSDNGTVDRILGEEAAAGTIYQPSHEAVGPGDRVYVADGRTNAVHVFDGDGRRVGICVPDAEDLTETAHVERITASTDGDVFVSLRRDDKAYVRFDKNLKRAGRVQIELDDVCQDWHFQPSGPLCWVRGYEDVFLVKSLHDVVRMISRRPDRQWLESPRSIGVAPDGSAAVVATNRSGEVSVNTYGPTGDPRATYVGPRGWRRFGQVAYDGRTAFFRDGNDLHVIGSSNRCIGSFRLPFDARNWSGPFVAAGGKQLWFVDCEHLTLHKYAIPRLVQPSQPRPRRDSTSISLPHN